MIFIEPDLQEYDLFVSVDDNYEFIRDLDYDPVTNADHYTLTIL